MSLASLLLNPKPFKCVSDTFQIINTQEVSFHARNLSQTSVCLEEHDLFFTHIISLTWLLNFSFNISGLPSSKTWIKASLLWNFFIADILQKSNAFWIILLLSDGHLIQLAERVFSRFPHNSNDKNNFLYVSTWLSIAANWGRLKRVTTVRTLYK